MAATAFLVEAFPRDGSNNPVRVGFSSGAPLPVFDGMLWRARIATALNYRGSIVGLPSGGTIDLVNVDSGVDSLKSLRWQNAPVTVYQGDPAADFSTFTVLRKARADSVLWSKQALQIVLRDASWISELQIQQSTFAGTGGLNGGIDLKGAKMPLVFGAAKQVKPVLIDAATLTYQVHERAINGIAGLWDGLVALSNAGDVSTLGLGSLAAWTPVPGRFLTDYANGRLRLGAIPARDITCDVNGDAVGGYAGTALAIVRRILTWKCGLGSGDLDASLTTLDGARPWAAGVALVEGGDRAFDVIQQLAQSVGCWLSVNALDQVCCGSVGWGASTAALRADQVQNLQKQQSDPPTWRQRIAYARAWTVTPISQAGEIVAGFVADRPASSVLYDLDNLAVQKLITGTLQAIQIAVGAGNLVIDGAAKQIRVVDAASVVRAILGNLGGTNWGLEIHDAAGGLIMSSGRAFDSSMVNALLTQNAPAQAGADVTGANLALGTAVTDTRAVNTPPSGYSVGRFTEFKQRATVGAPGLAAFGLLVTDKTWVNNSGGYATQTFLSSDGVFVRRAGNSDTSWGAWTTSFDSLNKPNIGNLDLAGQFTAANTGTYFALAAIGHALIGSVDALTITVNQLLGSQIAANQIDTGHLKANSVTLGPSTSWGPSSFTLTNAWTPFAYVSCSVDSANNLLLPFIAASYNMSVASGETLDIQWRLVDETAGVVVGPPASLTPRFTAAANTTSTATRQGAMNIVRPPYTGTRLYRVDLSDQGTGNNATVTQLDYLQVNWRR